MGVIARIIAFFRKIDDLDLADKLTEGVIDIFESARATLEEANELYAAASAKAEADIIEALDLVESLRFDAESIVGAIGANARRAAKLAEFTA